MKIKVRRQFSALVYFTYSQCGTKFRNQHSSSIISETRT